MAFTDYTTLVASVGDWLNRPGDAIVPDLITLNEVALRRRPELQYEVYADIDLDSGEVTLPDDCLEVTHLYLNTTEVRGAVEIVSPETLSEKLFLLGATGVPQFGSLIDNAVESVGLQPSLILAPSPDQTYAAKIIYKLKLVALDDTLNTVNWLLRDHPDIYLYGSLLKAEPYLKNDTRIAVWREEFERAVTDLETSLRRRRYSANTLVIRPRQAIG